MNTFVVVKLASVVGDDESVRSVVLNGWSVAV
jgi:hypothetical protein